MAYTNINNVVLVPPGPTLDERMTWFNDAHTFEEQDISRVKQRECEPDYMRYYRLSMECKEKSRTIERMIIKRCLPAPYRKDVGKTSNMYVSEMDDELWNFFVTNQQTPPTQNTKYWHSYPDHGYYRREEFHRIGWTNGNHPDLHTPHWYLTKWCENGRVYKSYIYSVNFIRNSFSGLVRCEYHYYVWLFNNSANGWIFFFFCSLNPTNSSRHSVTFVQILPCIQDLHKIITSYDIQALVELQ